MPSSIFVVGSLAYDRIMDFPGRFADHIMPDKIHVLNVSFTVNSMVERPGGTAGNIAYALTLLGEQPTIVATIGHDYHRYFKWMDVHRVSHTSVRIVEEEFTASAYITTDQADNQITGFNPGAMKHQCHYDVVAADPKRSLGIIAAGNVADMAHYSDRFRALGVPFIFDPAQSLPAWDKAELARCLAGARVLVSNDYELAMICEKTGLDKAALLKRVGAIVTTRGEHGSVVATEKGESVVGVAKLERPPVDPTGAGDAYRGGVIKGMLEGKPLEEAARMGSVCASFCVEVQGTQAYSFSAEQFQARHRASYGG
ncbi:MAG: carbohydrate kinase family protein [Dehalococcoidia bacterium]|nr:carbohydrate kinase family protein [Dehalococcoidia bacterium]